MTCFWPTTDEEKQKYIDYFNLSAKEQIEYATNLIPLIEEDLEIDRQYFGEEKQERCKNSSCEPPATSAGDALAHCYKCLNIRPDYYEWSHKRKILCASWGGVPFDKEKAQEYFKLIRPGEGTLGELG
jgi:hypothetical protein